MAKKSAKGSGTIRRKTVTRNGKEYMYWEARITTGRDPGTGKQIQRSFTGKTQKEVREKMQAAAVQINQGIYTAPEKMTVGQWLDVWTSDYLGAVKPHTVDIYRGNIHNHIKPALGAVRLTALHPHTVQGFVNGLTALSPSTTQLIYKILHRALEKAVELDYIAKNPAFKCTLPRTGQTEPRPLDDDQVTALLKAVRESDMEYIVTVALFTGLRLSELLGLTWDAIDFDKGTISVNKQLAQPRHRGDNLFQTPKSGKARIISPASTVFQTLKYQQIRQSEQRLKAGEIWNNPAALVFTSDSGEPFNQSKVERRFRNALAAAGLSGFHFHCLRHTYAVNAIRAGDNIKAIQKNLGHHTAAFTLDRYGHFTEQMAHDSATRMECFIKDVMKL